MLLLTLCKKRRGDTVDCRLGIVKSVDMPYAVFEHLLCDIYRVIERHLAGHILRCVIFCVFLSPPAGNPVTQSLCSRYEDHDKYEDPCDECSDPLIDSVFSAA